MRIRLASMFMFVTGRGVLPLDARPVASVVPARRPVRCEHAATPVPATGVACVSAHEQLLERAFPGWRNLP